MHGLVAAGGVAQLEVNGFCHAIVDAGISLESIDQFHAQVSWPCASRHNLPPQFFQTCAAEEPSGHIKAFAAETLSAVTVLAAFAVMVLQPAGSLPVHCTSMLLLATILDCFGFEAVALAHLDFLGDNVQRHHLLVVEVYGHIIAKFKMHQIYHCLHNFRKQRKLMSCFPMERKHKTAKALATHTKGTNWQNQVLKRSILDTFNAFDAGLVKEDLRAARHAPHLRPYLQFHCPDVLDDVEVAKQMRSGIGFVTAGTLVMLLVNGDNRLGVTKMFIGGTSLSLGEKQFCVVYERLVKTSPTTWAPSAEMHCCLSSSLVCTLPFFQLRCGGLRPLLPRLPSLNVV